MRRTILTMHFDVLFIHTLRFLGVTYAVTFQAVLVKLYGRHLLMKLNYNATHFECFSSTFHYATCFLPIPRSRLAGYDGRADTIISIPGFFFVSSLTKAHGQRMSHHSDLFNVGHGSENGKRPPQKNKTKLGSC
jgi:hypothetical protein